MKRCPTCDRTYTDESLNFCLDDGEWLVSDVAEDEPSTALLSGDPPSKTKTRPQMAVADTSQLDSPADRSRPSQKPLFTLALIALVAIAAAGIGYGIYTWKANRNNASGSHQSPKFQRLTTSGK